MAEGRFDDMEMGERVERYQEYEKEDTDTLSDKRDRLLELREGDLGYAKSRVNIITINNILDARKEGRTRTC